MDVEWILGLIAAVGVVVGIVVAKTKTTKDDEMWNKIKTIWNKFRGNE